MWCLNEQRHNNQSVGSWGQAAGCPAMALQPPSSHIVTAKEVSLKASNLIFNFIICTINVLQPPASIFISFAALADSSLGLNLPF